MNKDMYIVTAFDMFIFDREVISPILTNKKQAIYWLYINHSKYDNDLIFTIRKCES